jgi:hypothetical protein
MVEQGGRVEDNLKKKHGDRGRADQEDRPLLDEKRRQYFNGMKTDATGHVQIQVGMMHAVDPPKEGNRVKKTVLKINDEVQNDNGNQNGRGRGKGPVVKDSPALFMGQVGHSHGGGREEQAQEEGIQESQG